MVAGSSGSSSVATDASAARGAPPRSPPMQMSTATWRPTPTLPSLSFLSSFPGILAAGELIKEAMGGGQLRGHFDHVFRYGPNPDIVGCPRSGLTARRD